MNSFVTVVEVTWKEELLVSLPKDFWYQKENQRKFLHRYAKARGIQDPKDWSRATLEDIEEFVRASNLQLMERAGNL